MKTVRNIDIDIQSYFVLANKTNISTLSISKPIQTLLINPGGSRGSFGCAPPINFSDCFFPMVILRFNKINLIKW